MPQNVQYIISLRDQYSAKAAKATKATAGLNKMVAGLGVTMGAAGLAMAFANVVKVGAKFEKTMSSVKAISGATNMDFIRMGDQAEKLGNSTQFSATQAGEGMEFLSMAGFNTMQTMKAMPGVLDLAAAGAVDLGFAADTASNVLTQFGLKASEIGKVNDILVSTSSKANTNIQQLAEGLKYAGTTSKILNMPLSETSAALGVLADAGLQGSMGGTSFNMALLEMGKSTSPVVKKLKALGVETLDSNGNFVGLTESLRRMEAKGVDAKKALSIFGTRSGRAMGTLIEAGSEAVQELDDLNKASEGVAKRIAKMKMDNLAGDMTTLKSATQGFAISLSKKMNPRMRGSLKLVTKLVRGMDKMVKVPLSDNIRKQRTEFNALIGVLQNVNTSESTRKDAMAKLNTEYKEFLPNLITEKTTTEELAAAKAAANKEFLKELKFQAQRDIFQDIFQKAGGLEKRLNEYELQNELLKAQAEEYNNLTGAEKTAARAARGFLGDPTIEANQIIQSNNKVIARLKAKLDPLSKQLMRMKESGFGQDAAGGIIKNKVVTDGDPAAESLMSKITSAAPKIFNINIENLIDEFNINTKNLTESAPQTKELILKTVLEALNDTQINYR